MAARPGLLTLLQRLRLTPYNEYVARRAIGSAARGGFAVVGVLLTMLELLERNQLSADLSPRYRWLVAGVAVVYAGLRVRRGVRGIRRYSVEVGAGRKATVQVGDFIDNIALFPGASCAFGANDEFSVTGLRSDSAHAAFLDRYLPGDAESQAAIHLSAVQLVGAAPAGRHNYGTVIAVPFTTTDSSERLAFLVANSSRFTHGFGSWEDQGVEHPLGVVVDYHRQHRLQSETVVFSLIGTGHSRARTAMQSVFDLIDTFTAHLRDGRPCAIKHLVISIPERLVVEADFDIEAVHLYLASRAKMESAH